MQTDKQIMEELKPALKYLEESDKKKQFGFVKIKNKIVFVDKKKRLFSASQLQKLIEAYDGHYLNICADCGKPIFCKSKEDAIRRDKDEKFAKKFCQCEEN